MSVRRRLLFLAPRPPQLDGITGGQRVMAQTIRALAKRHAVALLYLRPPDERPIDPELQEACDYSEGVALSDGPLDRPPLRRLRRELLRLVHHPRSVLRTAESTFGERVRDVVAWWQPDVVHVEYHVMAQYVSRLRHCRAVRILTEYEPGITAAQEAYAARTGLAARARAWLESRTWARYERWAMRQMDAVVVFTHRDHTVLVPLAGRTPVIPIPFGTAAPPQPLDPLGRQPLTLLFVGNFVHPPNATAAIRLVRAILPRVQERWPEVKVEIVGARPPARVLQLAGEAVRIVGEVPSVMPYLNHAAVVVAPVDTGGGMRVKVSEALAAGKAVVSTPLGIEGLEVADGKHLRLATSDEQFATAIVELLASPTQRTMLAANARAWAIRHLTWKRPLDAREVLYEQLSRRQPHVDLSGAIEPVLPASRAGGHP